LDLGACEEDDVLTFSEEPGGKRIRADTNVDGTRFEEEWLQAVVSVAPDRWARPAGPPRNTVQSLPKLW